MERKKWQKQDQLINRKPNLTRLKHAEPSNDFSQTKPNRYYGQNCILSRNINYRLNTNQAKHANIWNSNLVATTYSRMPDAWVF